MNRGPAPMYALALLLPSAAAAGPDNVVLSAMAERNGDFVADRDQLATSYRQLVREVGTLIATSPGPAHTAGVHGLEAEVLFQAGIIEGRLRGDPVSPWSRAHATGDSSLWLGQPMVQIRKGLPLSTEIGGHLSWIGNTSTGSAGAWGRVAVVEGYRPLPDVSVHAGWSSYLGNDELDLGVFDFGLTLGTRMPVGPGSETNGGDVAVWADITGVRTYAVPRLDDDDLEAIGAVAFGPGAESVTTLARIAAGLRWRAGAVFFRIDGDWTPATIPTVRTGLGWVL